MDAAEANKYGKIAYESNLSHLLDSDWESLNDKKKRYWIGIAIAVVNAYKDWQQQHKNQ